MFGFGFAEGQHVVVSRDLDGWLGPLGYRAVRKGTRAIVRRLPSGWLSDRYVVELPSGRQVTVSARNLRPAFLGHGDDSWRRYKANRAGIRLGMLVLSIPAFLTLLRYCLAGGTTSALIAAVPGMVGSLGVEIVGRAIALLGLPMVVCVLALSWLRRRRNPRR